LPQPGEEFEHRVSPATAKPPTMRNVAGRSDDGVVEAIEDADRDFVVGVQWHAERLVDDPTHRQLFAALVDAARLRVA
jgi:gamma-glutamyl-gamma-aminobutyrate hydrolase PuuD